MSNHVFPPTGSSPFSPPSRFAPRGPGRAARRAAVPLLIAVLAAAAPRPAAATPSTNFWAPSTPGVQGYGVLHLTYDTYFNHQALYPIDAGLTIGVLPGSKLQAEVGFDFFYPTFASSGPIKAPIQLNAKLGSPEGAFFAGSPAWSAGIYAVGFEEDVTDYDVLHAMVGRTFPGVGSLAVGGYYGLNPDLLRSASGAEERGGLMAGWFSPAIDVPVIDRVHLTWDVQTGENVLGATGGGVYLYVTPAVDVLLGPVFFLEKDLQPGRSSWMWSLQLDVDFDLRR
jgi:hypothetical protein